MYKLWVKFPSFSSLPIKLKFGQQFQGSTQYLLSPVLFVFTVQIALNCNFLFSWHGSTGRGCAGNMVPSSLVTERQTSCNFIWCVLGIWQMTIHLILKWIRINQKRVPGVEGLMWLVLHPTISDRFELDSLQVQTRGSVSMFNQTIRVQTYFTWRLKLSG